MPNEDRDARLFAAVELPEEWRSTIAADTAQLQSVAGRAVKWVRPELMHVTLVFLGDQPQTRMETIRAAMDSAAGSATPFRISLGRPGFFGSPERVRTLWVGLQDTPAGLTRLHAELVARLSEHQVPFDRKPLVPHITIARARSGIDRSVSLRLHAELQRLDGNRRLSSPVREITLLESRLHPGGPEYIPVHRARLGGESGD